MVSKVRMIWKQVDMLRLDEAGAPQGCCQLTELVVRGCSKEAIAQCLGLRAVLSELSIDDGDDEERLNSSDAGSKLLGATVLTKRLTKDLIIAGIAKLPRPRPV